MDDELIRQIKRYLHLNDQDLGKLVKQFIKDYDQSKIDKKQSGYDSAMMKLNPKEVEIEGVMYPSINKAMKGTGYTRSKILKITSKI